MAYRINLTQESYNKMMDQKKQKDRKSGNLMKKSDLAGVIGYGAADTEGETYVPTEQEYQRNNPNSAEFRKKSIDDQNKRQEKEYQDRLKLNQLKSSKPWLFGYGAGAYAG